MRPTNRLTVAVVVVVLLVLMVSDEFVRALVGLLLAVALFDLAIARRRSDVDVQRIVNPSLSVNREVAVTLHLSHKYDGDLACGVCDRAPVSMRSTETFDRARIPKDVTVELRYPIKPTLRGDFVLTHADLVIDSPLGLWQLRRAVPFESHVRVYPDFEIIAQYLELVSDRRVTRLGIKLAPRRGEGLEFHQLREYREGDTLRQIDWKATSRRRELISREYQEERDQRVVFMIDSGRRMRSLDGELSHFDHALNAMLLLGYVALRQGDTVSLLSFGATKKWVSDVSGVRSVSRLLNDVYDLDTGPVGSDYVGAAEEIMTRQRKRALVVLMTNLREEDNDLPQALELLATRHVVMLANLREKAIDDTLDGEVVGFEEALMYAGAVRHLAERREIQRNLSTVCPIIIESTPRDLPVRVVNGYWQIKRAGSL